MATICDKKKWKNKRNRSLYDKEADNGFIFRVPGVVGRVSANESTKQEVEEELSVEEVRKQVEVDRFLSDLRKGMMEAGSNLTQEQLEDGFQQLAQDLTESDLYIRYLNEEEEVRDDQRTDDDHAPQLMSTITESMEKCQREITDWKTLIEERQILTEQAKEGYSKEKHLDFLRLPAKDIRPLKSFLSSEQLTLIEPEGPSDFISSTTEQLDILESQLEQELIRLSALCYHTTPNLQQLDQSMLKATPRTIFKAVQDLDPNQTFIQN